MPTWKLLVTLLPGIVAADRLDLSPAIPLALAAAVLLILVLSPPHRTPWPARGAIVLLPSLLFFFRAEEAATPARWKSPASGTVRGVVHRGAGGRIVTLRTGDAWPGSIDIPWIVPHGDTVPPAGSIVEITGAVAPFPFPRNRTGRDRFARYRRRGAPGVFEGELTAWRPGRSAAGRARRAIGSRIDRLGSEEAALLKALLLGDRSGVSKERTDAFRTAGLSHLLALSGLHVGILYVLLSVPLASLPLPRRAVPALAVSFLWFYGAVADYPVSLVRALIMASLLATGVFFRWPVRPGNALGAAALVSLFLDPGAHRDVAFQLSFAATAGILASRPLVSALAARGPIGRLFIPLLVGVSAQAATLPFIVYHFQQIPLLAAPATLLTAPLATLALTASVFWLAAGMLLPAVEPTLEAGAWGALRLFGTTVERIASAAPAPWIICRQSTAAAAIPPAILLLTALAVRRKSIRPLLVLPATLLLLLHLPAPFPFHRRSLPLTVTFLDVGQGSATLIEQEGGGSFLVDAGGRSDRWDNGASVIAPFLRRTNMWPLSGGIVSHPDADHMGGMISLLEEGGIGRIRDPGVDHRSDLYRRYVRAAMAAPAGWAACRTGETFSLGDGAVLRILYAPEGRTDGCSTNDASLIVLLTFGRFTLLLPGDATPRLERYLTVHHLADAITMVAVPHHGARGGCPPAFLERARPRFAVISVGARNRYGHPDDGIVRRLEKEGCLLLRTDIAGGITVRTDGRRLTIETASPRIETMAFELPPAPRRAAGF